LVTINADAARIPPAKQQEEGETFLILLTAFVILNCVKAVLERRRKPQANDYNGQKDGD
jgi:hypothetical protein